MTILDGDESECYSVLAFYGLDEHASDAVEFYVNLVGWFETLGHCADVISVHGRGFSGKTNSFRGTHAKLIGKDLSDVTSISLSSLIQKDPISVNDYLLSAFWHIDNRIILTVKSSILDIDNFIKSRIVDIIIAMLRPSYAIGYDRNSYLGPALYALGISQGFGNSDSDYQEMLSISFWGRAEKARIWDTGLIRDVYPLNILNNSQISASVETKTVGEWIAAEESRGYLKRIGENLTLWTLEEANIPSVRRHLIRAGVVLDWTRDLEGAHAHPYAEAARSWALSR